MNHIKTYKLFESMGFPDSLRSIVDISMKEIEERYIMWYNRKGHGNYTDNISLTFDKEISNNKDFPIKTLNIKLSIKKPSQYDASGASGRASMFANKREKDIEAERSKLFRGKILRAEIDIGIQSSFMILHIDDMKVKLEEVLRHELLHIYQDYKGRSKNIKPDHTANYFNNILMEYFYNCGIHKLEEFLYSIYPTINNSEYSAFIAQLGAAKSKLTSRTLNGLKVLKKIINKGFDKIYQEIMDEVNNKNKKLIKSGQEPMNLDDLASIIKSELVDNLKYSKIENPKWLDQYTKTDFKSLLKNLYDQAERRSEKIFKKSSKILYTSNLLESKTLGNGVAYMQNDWIEFVQNHLNMDDDYQVFKDYQIKQLSELIDNSNIKKYIIEGEKIYGSTWSWSPSINKTGKIKIDIELSELAGVGRIGSSFYAKKLIFIRKLEDEYYAVNTIDSAKRQERYYICDQFDEVIELIKNIII